MYTLCNLILQPIKLQEMFDNPLVWKLLLLQAKRQEPVRLILTVRMKSKTFPKAFFPREQD